MAAKSPIYDSMNLYMIALANRHKQKYPASWLYSCTMDNVLHLHLNDATQNCLMSIDGVWVKVSDVVVLETVELRLLHSSPDLMGSVCDHFW